MQPVRVSFVFRLIFVLVLVYVLAVAGHVVYKIFWGPDRSQWAGQSLSQMLESGDLLALICIPGAWLLIIITLLVEGVRALFPPTVKNGVVAPARVLKVWDTGTTINDDPQVGLLLEVTPADGGAPFQVETKTLVSRLNAVLVQPGVMAEVKYDPHKPKRLAVLALHTPDVASTGAAARLTELNQLRDQGLITAAEYQHKRAEILKVL